MSDRNSPSHEQIQQRAYELYQERGGEHGREHEDWFAAEQEISDHTPRELPPGLEALPPQNLQKAATKDDRNDSTKMKKKAASSAS
jgi:hypothetical protein